jgi:hypothetical protein
MLFKTGGLCGRQSVTTSPWGGGRAEYGSRETLESSMAWILEVEWCFIYIDRG